VTQELIYAAVRERPLHGRAASINSTVIAADNECSTGAAWPRTA